MLRTLLSVCLNELSLGKSKDFLKNDGTLDIVKIVYIGSFIWNNIEYILDIPEENRVYSICSM